jgi:uncharacterized membrane protein YdbT with pleckstrin-like domain
VCEARDVTQENATQGSAAEGAEQILYEGHPAVLPTLGAWCITILTLGLAAIYFAIRAKSQRYKLTNQRIVLETGILSKRLDQIDTYRINDYVVERPFGQRLVGTGNLILSALDRSTPEVRIFGLKTDVTVLYEQLRRATEEQKARRGVRVLDTEHPHH